MSLVTDEEAELMAPWIGTAGLRLLATREALMEALEDSHSDCRRVSELLSDYACPGCDLLAAVHGGWRTTGANALRAARSHARGHEACPCLGHTNESCPCEGTA